MFVCDELIYIQLQKTGCTHIARLLSRLFDGRKIGKHNKATAAQLESGRKFISSIRNPWDWYVSVWSFGVAGKGMLFQNVTKRKRVLKKLRRLYLRTAGDFDVDSIGDEAIRITDSWRQVYDSTNNVDSFRRWLRKVNDPDNSDILGEGYGMTVLPNLCGLMSYRFLNLCCRNFDEFKLNSQVVGTPDLENFFSQNRYVHDFIRMENLENSFCNIVEQIRPLTDDERQWICGLTKTNVSQRRSRLADYYDQESIDLVAAREKLIINRFQYEPPI